MQKTIDIDAVAEMLGVSRSSVRRLWYAGQLPKPVRLGRRSIRWRIEELQQFIADKMPVMPPQAKEVAP